MLADVRIDGLIGIIALGLPIFALLTTIALALRRRRRKKPATTADAPKSTARYGDDAKPASPPPEVPASRPPANAGAAPEPRVVGKANRRYAARTEPKWPSQQTAAQPAPPLSAEALTAAIKNAETKGDQTQLPGLYLALAGHSQAGGGLSEAAELLRKSIRIAVATGRNEEHAKARLELGDIARMSGDLTTACEHWQIARRLYQEMSRKAELATAEARMRDNGCPTDWVLNDF